MKKGFLKSLKRLIVYNISIMMATVGIFNGNVVKAAESFDFTTLFDYQYQSGDKIYKATWKTDFADKLKEAGITEVVIPETYNDGENGEHPISASGSVPKNDTLTAITYNKATSGVANNSFGGCSALTKVEFLYTGTDFYFGGKIFASFKVPATFTYSDSIKEMYIHADMIRDGGVPAAAFQGNNTGIKIYVTNDTVKNSIINGTKDGSYPVADSSIEIKKDKSESKLAISCKDIYFGEKNGFQPEITEKVGDGEITYILYKDEACSEEASYGYNGSSIPVGVYYIRGMIASTDNYGMATSNVVKVEVKKNEPADKTALNAAIDEAKKFLEDNKYDKENYTPAAWKKVEETLSQAESIAKDTEGKYNQEQVNTAEKDLTDALAAIKAPADNTEAWNKLQTLIKQADDIVVKVTNKEVEYTEKTYAEFTKQLNNAKALDKSAATTTIKEINRIYGLLESAINKLEIDPGPVVEAGEPFAYVNKKGKETKVLSLKADDRMAGVNKIKLTLKCAEDVSFNENADLDVTAVVAGKNNYQKFKGNSWEAGATFTVELPLTEAVKAGDNIDLSLATYSWDNAKDYVYGLTKVEFFNEKGKIVYTKIDKDVHKETLASAIKDAEGVDTSIYTEDSVANLTKALEAAKALKDDATADELKKAIDAINAAIEGLKKKGDSPKPDDQNKNPQPTKVIGPVKGKTFTAGNFNYKVTVASTMTGTKVTAGKVTVVGLTKTGKKKSSVNVKNTVKKGSASYQVTALGSKVFKKAAKLKKATLGTNIKSIPTSAFEGCKKLTTVSAKGVTKIGKSAFKNCKKLKKLTLGKKKLSSVKKGAFKGCKKTIKVTGGSKKVKKANIKKLKKSGYKKFK